MMGTSEGLMNIALPVIFQGWRSDTLTLQREGWRIAQYHDPSRFECQFIFSNEVLRIGGLSDVYDMHSLLSFQKFAPEGTSLPPIKVNHLADARIVEMPSRASLDSFAEIDAEPRYVENRPRMLFEHGAFLPKSQEQTFVNAADMEVVELLELIKNKQQPRQDEIRESISSGRLATQLDHGRIITVAAA